MASHDLLPCPHCGGEGDKLYPSGGISVRLAPPVPLYGCARCQYGFPTAEQWNTRAAEAELREALKGMIAKFGGAWHRRTSGQDAALKTARAALSKAGEAEGTPK